MESSLLAFGLHFNAAFHVKRATVRQSHNRGQPSLPSACVISFDNAHDVNDPRVNSTTSSLFETRGYNNQSVKCLAIESESVINFQAASGDRLHLTPRPVSLHWRNCTTSALSRAHNLKRKSSPAPVFRVLCRLCIFLKLTRQAKKEKYNGL